MQNQDRKRREDSPGLWLLVVLAGSLFRCQGVFCLPPLLGALLLSEVLHSKPKGGKIELTWAKLMHVVIERRGKKTQEICTILQTLLLICLCI